MKDPAGYRVPDITDYMLSDAGAGHDYFFLSSPGPPGDSALRFYCHQACLMLGEGGDPEKIAGKLGFPDYSLFCRQFKEYTGLAPEGFRDWILDRKITWKRHPVKEKKPLLTNS